MRRAASFLLFLAGCAPVPPPAAAPAGRAFVLVEAAGTGPEAEAFVSRFLSVLADRGLGNVADARLSGVALEALRDPNAPTAAAFRRRYPGDGYVGIDLPGCGPVGRGSIQCTATVRLLSPEGKELVKVDASGSNFTGISEGSDRSPETEAARAAAEKAARRFLAALGR
jgi:hypothetical protein